MAVLASLNPARLEDFQINTRSGQWVLVFRQRAGPGGQWPESRVWSLVTRAECQIKLWQHEILSRKLSNVILRGILTSFVISSENQKTSHLQTVKMNRQGLLGKVGNLSGNISPGCQEIENNKMYSDTSRSRGAGHVAEQRSSPTNCWGNFMLITGLLLHIWEALAKFIYL